MKCKILFGLSVIVLGCSVLCTALCKEHEVLDNERGKQLDDSKTAPRGFLVKPLSASEIDELKVAAVAFAARKRTDDDLGLDDPETRKLISLLNRVAFTELREDGKNEILNVLVKLVDDILSGRAYAFRVDADSAVLQKGTGKQLERQGLFVLGNSLYAISRLDPWYEPTKKIILKFWEVSSDKGVSQFLLQVRIEILINYHNNAKGKHYPVKLWTDADFIRSVPPHFEAKFLEREAKQWAEWEYSTLVGASQNMDAALKIAEDLLLQEKHKDDVRVYRFYFYSRALKQRYPLCQESLRKVLDLASSRQESVERAQRLYLTLGYLTAEFDPRGDVPFYENAQAEITNLWASVRDNETVPLEWKSLISSFRTTFEARIKQGKSQK